jgi:outer membrane receptor protein involved in Fe transport
VSGLAIGGVPAALAAEALRLPEVSVVGVTPVLGTGIDIARVPGNVQVLSVAEAPPGAPGTVAQMLDSRLGSISIADYQGNPLQPNLSFRGFTASPVLGDPQGLAVYQNGMRLNEAFGDLVHWDMLPSFAVDTLQVLPGSNPAFGLNAQGGAIAMRMKDGFSHPGGRVEIGGGSFGRAKTMVEQAASFGNLGVYAGLSAQNDEGWRNHSPSRLIQGYGDLALRTETLDLGLGLTVGASDLSGLGTAPLDLLDSQRNAVLTFPDNTQNGLVALTLRGSRQIDDALSVQGNAYVRHLRTATHNGDPSGFSDCGGASAGTLCNDDGDQILARGGGTIESGNTGVINNTTTDSTSVGASGQITRDGVVLGRRNTATAGLTSDLGWTRYDTNSEIGILTTERGVVGTGRYYDDGSAVSLDARNSYYGAFLTDTISLTDRLHLSLAGRLNLAWIELIDRRGGDLSGQHYYQRFNPSVGLTWQAFPAITVFGSYGEANRAPTAAELACADSTKPCRMPNAFQSDPSLKQVVSRTIEAGARGTHQLGAESDKVGWSLALFATRNESDIIFVNSGTLTGQGYFTNVGSTLRKGLEAGVDASLGNWTLAASYALVDATFDSFMQIASPHNSAAVNGVIQVSPGNQMPGIPQHSLKLSAEYALSEDWTLGGAARITSGRYYRGDESNTMKQIPGFAVFDARTAYSMAPGSQVFFEIHNIADTRTATAGTLGDPSGGIGAFGFTSNRFLAPGEPRSLWAGLRISY